MKKILRFSPVAVLCLLLVLFFSFPVARAQQTLGSLNGTVTDISGAAVPGASVTAVSEQTGLTRSAKSKADGYWEILNLPVGTYRVKVSAPNFQTAEYPTITVREALAATINASLKPGQVTQSVIVNANPLLNATDTTNGYTLGKDEIQQTPLATGSFTQLAVLSPGVNAELLSGMDTNAGLGNQNIWANGQRATSNTWQVDGVDVTNIFNGMSGSGLTSQRWNFNIGGGSPSSTSSAGQADIGGSAETSTSVYGSNGNSLPSPPPEFLQEMRVNTSMYDAQQGETAGAQIDVNTATGTNDFHGQIYGNYANSALNSAPFFFKQQASLAGEGVGAFPSSLANPLMHNWWTGATVGGPVIKNKLFFFAGYEYRYVSDQATGLSQMTVPSGLTNDRTPAGLIAAATSWQGKPFTGTLDPVAEAIMNAKLPDGSYMIPSSQTPTSVGQYGFVPNVTLIGTSLLTANQANASLQYNVSNSDLLTAKYYYQSDPDQKTYGMSSTGGFPQTQENGSQVGAISNSNTLGSRMNLTETLGFVRMYSYSYFTQTVPGGNFGIGGSNPAGFPVISGMPGLLIQEMAGNSTVAPGLKTGPYDSFADIGYYQNRLNPSADAIFTLGKHTLTAGGGFTYTQLNIENNRDRIPQIESKNFASFLEGGVKASSLVESVVNGRNNANRYYRMNEGAAYAQDKWQVLPNLSITAGLRYDYHGGLTEKYGNMFNFDPSLYDVTGSTTTGFVVNNAGFVIAGNNKYNPTRGVSDSTLAGRQWGLSPRVGFAWSPKKYRGTVVWRGGAGLYYDRGEYFTYLSQPAGAGYGGPFGVTESAPLASYVVGTGSTLENYLGTPVYTPAGSDPSVITQQLQATLNGMTGSPAAGSKYAKYGPNCGGVQSQEGYTLCPDTLNFGAYDKNNVLPYSINFGMDVEWQPSTNIAITLGYTGNRGRHSVVPIPFNEPLIATASNPVHGETASYGFDVLNQNASPPGDPYDYAPIAGEPWNTEDGGNTDFRAPYVGFSPNAAMFKTVGTSAYDALETHLEKRFSRGLSGGLSYTFSHTYDEQSDLGLFFTGDNPNDLRSSYARADFDRTNVITGNFDYALPKTRGGRLLTLVANDWHIGGWGVAQSGQPYSLYEFYGAVGSVYFGDYPTLMNPVLPIKNAKNPKQALTGNNGAFRSGPNYIPAIDPDSIDIHYLQPGEKGIPVSTGSDPQDVYETDFAPGQRNLFRQAFQKQLNLTVRKQFHPTERLGLEYDFNVFNVTNTPSLDVPQNQTQIRQNYGCSASAYAAYGGDNNCADAYVNYGQVATSDSPADQQSARSNLDQLPYHTGTGKNIRIPLTLPVAQNTSCSYATLPNGNGCPNNGANFGSVTSVIGSARMITMGLHITF